MADSSPLREIYNLHLCENETLPQEDGPIPVPTPAVTSRSTPSGPKDRPLSLVVSTIDTFNGVDKKDLSPLQTRALSEMKDWITLHTAIEMTQVPSDEVKTFIQNFSRVFFLADLSPDMIDFQFCNTLVNRTNVLGYQSHAGGGKGGIRIRIDSGDWSGVKHLNVKDHKTALLSTLFHECVHAYIDAFCCDNPLHLEPTNDFTTLCKSGSEHYREGEGHFATWFLLSAAIDIALPKLLGLEFDLGVFEAVLREYTIKGGARYPADEWRRLFATLEWDGVNKLLKRLDLIQLDALGNLLRMNEDANRIFSKEYRARYPDEDWE